MAGVLLLALGLRSGERKLEVTRRSDGFSRKVLGMQACQAVLHNNHLKDLKKDKDGRLMK